MIINTEPVRIDQGIFEESVPEHLHDIFYEYLPNKSFIDLGSGLGKVVTKALEFTPHAFGIENELFLADNSESYSQIIRDDMFTHDLSSYDVIFYYLIGTWDEDILVEKIINEHTGIIIMYDYNVQEFWKNAFHARCGALELIHTFEHGKIYR